MQPVIQMNRLSVKWRINVKECAVDVEEAEVGDSHEYLGKGQLLRLRTSKSAKVSQMMKAEKKSKVKIVQRLTLKKMQRHNSQSLTPMLGRY